MMIDKYTADLISRQAAEAALVFAKGTGDIKCKDMRVIIDALRSVPSADVQEVKHGHWDGDSCSVCWFSWCDVTYDIPKMQMQYCPNCGVKMEG